MKKVVVIGPESTGKSTLCKQLADYYNTVWCDEYAREYLTRNGVKYTYNDLLAIAEGQLQLQINAIDKLLETKDKRNTNLIFFDTDLYVMKVWCEYVFGKCHHFILDQIALQQYDLYLLCKTDLPWVYDELREYPEENIRDELYAIYKDILVNQKTPWVEIGGSYEERLKKAVRIVDTMIYF